MRTSDSNHFCFRRNAGLWLCLAAGLIASVSSSPASTNAPAAQGQGLTLSNAIFTALAHNPGFRATQGRIAAALGRAESARAWPNPSLELEAEEVPVRRGNFSDSKNLAGVSQTLPFPGKKQWDRRVAGAELAAAENHVQAERRLVVQGVSAAYWRLAAHERLVETSEALGAVAANSADTARKLVEAGAIAMQEQLRVELQAEQARAELLTAIRERDHARQSLATWLGAPAEGGTADPLPDTAAPERPPEQAGKWIDTHPRVTAAAAELQAARAAVRRARLERYPDVTLGAAGGRSGRDDAAIVEFRASVPLPIFNRAKGSTREAEAKAAMAEANLEVTRQELRRAWEASAAQLRTASAQAANYRERILPKAEEALRLVRAGFEQGKFGVMDLLDTQRTVSESRKEYYRILLELNTSQAELNAYLYPLSQ